MGTDGDRSLNFSKIDQVGIVVRNVDEAVEYYSSQFGIGPFEIREVYRPDAVVRGNITPYRVRLAFAMMGQVELELIQVLEGKTIHVEFLEKNGEGLHHVGVLVDSLDAGVAQATRQGIGVLQTHKHERGGFAYLDTERVTGVIFELIEEKPKPTIQALSS